VDCSPWCTTPEYPYQNAAYSINYLWAYGNFSRLFVVETNVVCEGFNPSGKTLMTVFWRHLVISNKIECGGLGQKNISLATINREMKISDVKINWLIIKTSRFKKYTRISVHFRSKTFVSDACLITYLTSCKRNSKVKKPLKNLTKIDWALKIERFVKDNTDILRNKLYIAFHWYG
jgi:hypothetical protein